MKKLIMLIFCVVACILPSMALNDHPRAHFGEFGLEHLSDADEYRAKYLNQVVMYVPCDIAKPSYDDQRFVNTCKGEFMRPYKIVKISGDKKTIKFEMVDTSNSNKKIKFQFRNYYEYWSYGNNTWCNTDTYQVPLLLVDQLNATRQQLTSKIFTDPEVNFSVRISDLKLIPSEKSGEYPTICVSLLNEATNTEINIPYDNAKISSTVRDIFLEAKSGKYIALLSSVEKPSNSEIRYCETEVTSTDDMLSKFVYTDNILSVIIFASPSQFNFEITNLSDNTLKIIWDEAVIIDFDGMTSRVMHKGTKYSTRNDSQPPSTIIKGAKLEDIAAPTEKVYYDEYLNCWRNGYMFPGQYHLTGKQISLMLPIQIKDVVNEYIFVFDLQFVNNHPEWLVSE